MSIEINNFNYNFLKPKIDKYFSDKSVTLFKDYLHNNPKASFSEFGYQYLSGYRNLELEYKPLLNRLYKQLNIDCEKYGIYILIGLNEWSRLIEYLANQRRNNSGKTFPELIEETVDLHFKALREDKLRTTGWL